MEIVGLNKRVAKKILKKSKFQVILVTCPNGDIQVRNNN